MTAPNRSFAARVRAGCKGVVGAGFSALVLLGSCRQLAGVEERTPCEASEADSTPCGACLRASCCDALLACRNEPECAALEGCVSDCPDEICRIACRKSHERGFGDAFAVLASCSTSACTGVCQNASSGYIYPSLKCAECGNASCGEEATACASSSDCLALAFWERPCARNDNACRGKSQRRYPAGVGAEQALAECLASSCQSPCEYPAQPWGCLDDPEPPPRVAGTFQLHFTASPAVNVAGVRAQLCDKDDVFCDGPTAPVSDSYGKLTLAYPDGFDGYGLGEHPDYISKIFRLYALPPELINTGEIAIEMTTLDQHTGFTALIAPHNPELAHLVIVATNCDLSGAPGISFELAPPDDDAVPFYGEWGEVPGTMTGKSGRGGFSNVKPGKYVVREWRRDTGECVAETTLVARKGTVTFALGGFPHRCGSTPAR